MDDPTLSYWDVGGLDQFRSHRTAVEDAIEHDLRSVLAEVGAVDSKEVAALRALHKAHIDLRSTLIQRWKQETVKSPVGVMSQASPESKWPPPTESVARVADLASPRYVRLLSESDKLLGRMRQYREELLGNQYIGMSARGRWRHLEEDDASYTKLAEDCSKFEQALVSQIARKAHARLQALLEHPPETSSEGVESWEPPPGIAERIDSSLEQSVPGDGRFIMQSGWMILGSPVIGVLDQWVSDRVTTTPAMIDLDDEGGLITDSRVAVDSLVRRLLAVVPAGRMQLKVFDPQHLGRSVKDLFAIDEVSEKIIPDKVFSTRRELEELMEKLEWELTEVTRKYLGAEHSTLHDYNLSAGEVAEPYRLLLLYDFPHGWDRGDGQVDADLVSRLAKVIKAGPRCGLFTFIHVPEPKRVDLESYPLPQLFHTQRFVAPKASRWELRDGGSARPSLSAVRKHGARVMVSLTSYQAWRPPDPEEDMQPAALRKLTERLASDLRKADDVSVAVDKVADLAKKAARGKEPAAECLIADRDDLSTWWRGASGDLVTARFGRLGATAVAELTLDSKDQSAWLIGGAPGSGKSVLLHAVINDLCMNYPPGELELWLADLKHGVEFKPYAEFELPHARVVALQAGREFVVDMLRHIDAEQERRAVKLRKAGVQNIGDYKSLGVGDMPRLVAIIDEFQGLFEVDDKLGEEAARLLDHIVKQGRGFGVHVILASQQISGVALPRQLLNLIQGRIALRSSEADSMLILGNDDNRDAAELTRAGEGIINTHMSHSRDKNQRFQATHIQGADVVGTLVAQQRLAKREGWVRTPTVMDASERVTMDSADLARLSNVVDGLTTRVPIGRPMGMGGTVSLELEREPEGNVLLVMGSDDAASVVCQFVAAAFRGGLQVAVVNFGGLGGDLGMALDPPAAAAERATGSTVSFPRPRQLGDVLRNLADLIREREDSRDFRAEPRVLMLTNVNRAPHLAPEVLESLEFILEAGAEVGVHVVVQADSPALLKRFPVDVDKFATRIVSRMGSDDSYSFTESEYATDLPVWSVVLATPRMGEAATVRLFEAPAVEFWQQV